MLSDIELRVVKVILSDGCIPSGTVREWLNSKDRIILTKTNFPNIRHLLYSYMTAFRKGMYRGGMSWVCVISAKDNKVFQDFIEGQPSGVVKR